MLGWLGYIKTLKRSEISVMRIQEAALRRARDVPHQIAWRLPTPRNLRNRRQLSRLANIHSGERCFVLANGPSLGQMDLSPLQGHITIGMNRVYKMQSRIGFLPTYLVVTDMDTQLDFIADEIDALDTIRIVNFNARRKFRDSADTLFLKEHFTPHFSTDVRRGVWGGHSVTFNCLQLAYFMGFSEVVLLGKDHSYDIKGVPGQRVTATGAENNHMVTGYYSAGQSWRVPNYRGEEFAYSLARRAFEADGRAIFDATVGGKLKIFEKRDFSSFF